MAVSQCVVAGDTQDTATSASGARPMAGSATTIPSKLPNAVYQQSQLYRRSHSMSPTIRRISSQVGLSVAQCCA